MVRSFPITSTVPVGGGQAKVVEMVGAVIGQSITASDDRVGVGHGIGAAVSRQRSAARQAGLVGNGQGAVHGQGVAAQVQGAARRDGEGVPAVNGKVSGQGDIALHGCGLAALAVDQPAAVAGGGRTGAYQTVPAPLLLTAPLNHPVLQASFSTHSLAAVFYSG